MASKYEALFTPFKIGNCEVRNRVIIPAMEGFNIVENMLPMVTQQQVCNMTGNASSQPQPSVFWECYRCY